MFPNLAAQKVITKKYRNINMIGYSIDLLHPNHADKRKNTDT